VHSLALLYPIAAFVVNISNLQAEKFLLRWCGTIVRVFDCYSSLWTEPEFGLQTIVVGSFINKRKFF